MGSQMSLELKEGRHCLEIDKSLVRNFQVSDIYSIPENSLSSTNNIITHVCLASKYGRALK